MWIDPFESDMWDKIISDDHINIDTEDGYALEKSRKY